jgi:hypothetical protein
MASTVPARTLARPPKSHSTDVQLSALSLVSATIIHGVTGLDLAWTVVILVIVLVVIVPGAWSGRGYRRRVALELIDRL